MMARRSFNLASRLAPAVQDLPEVRSATQFSERVYRALDSPPVNEAEKTATLRAQPELVRTALTSAMATTHLHTQSRIAAYGGYGYYTIGPCGEELMSAATW